MVGPLGPRIKPKSALTRPQQALVARVAAGSRVIEYRRGRPTKHMAATVFLLAPPGLEDRQVQPGRCESINANCARVLRARGLIEISVIDRSAAPAKDVQRPATKHSWKQSAKFRDHDRPA